MATLFILIFSRRQPPCTESIFAAWISIHYPLPLVPLWGVTFVEIDQYLTTTTRTASYRTHCGAVFPRIVLQLQPRDLSKWPAFLDITFGPCFLRIYLAEFTNSLGFNLFDIQDVFDLLFVLECFPFHHFLNSWVHFNRL